MKKGFNVNSLKILLALLISICMASIVLGLNTDRSITSSGITVGTSSQYTESSADTEKAEGGNVSQMTINGTFSTSKWTAFYGNVTGEVFLGSGTTVLKRFGKTNLTGIKAVWASTDSSFNFASLLKSSKEELDGIMADIDTEWGAQKDNATNTFSSISTNLSGLVGYDAVNTTGYSKSGTSCTKIGSEPDVNGGRYNWSTVVAEDTASPSAHNDFAFGVRTGDNCNFLNSSANYQLLIPTPNAHLGTLTSYNFFLALV
jgi:hypothetical protein